MSQNSAPKSISLTILVTMVYLFICILFTPNQKFTRGNLKLKGDEKPLKEEVNTEKRCLFQKAQV